MSKKVIQKLRMLGYTRDDIARATGIAPRTQTRILNIRGYTKRVSRETKAKLSSIAPKYEEIKYKRSKVIDLDRFSSYRLFDAKIGEKRWQTIRERFDAEEISSEDVIFFILDKAPKTRFVSAKIGFYNEAGKQVLGKSTVSFDTSGDRIEDLKLLANNTWELVQKGLEESGLPVRFNYRTKEWEELEEDELEDEDQEIVDVEIELVGIVKGL